METKEKNCCRQTKRDEEDKKQIIIRLNKIIGQMNGVKKMIENDSRKTALVLLGQKLRKCLFA